MIDWFKGYLKYQLTDMSNVRVMYDYVKKHNSFYIDSPAGQIIYKPKNLEDLTRFRNEYINRLQELKKQEDPNDPVFLGDMFEFYREIMSREKVKYKANWRTRLRCNLGVW